MATSSPRPVIPGNFLSPHAFQFDIHRLPHVSFNVQGVEIPGITIGTVTQPSPFIDYPIHGDKAEFDMLSVTMSMDENLLAFREIKDWMIGLTFPDQFSQRTSLVAGDGLYSDATLTILTNSKNPNVSVKFSNIFPVSIGSINMSVDSNDVNNIKNTVSFALQKYELVDV